LEYESEGETSIGSALPLYTTSLSPPPPLLSSPVPIDSPSTYNMSQINLHEIIHQQQEQLATMQVQIQALLVAGAGAGSAATGLHIKVAKLAIFNGEAEKVGRFISVCKLYIRMRLRGELVEGQVQWILSYVQGGSADVWKENVLEKLESGEIEYEMAEEFLLVLKKEFGEGEKESTKVVELRKLEQGRRMMEEFVQQFKRAARESRYEGRPLVKEFKRGINRGIRRKLMEAENPLASIEQWYKRATALDRNWRESRREEERLKGKKEMIGGAPKQEQKQIMPQSLVW